MSMEICEIKIALIGIEPAIWRRLQVPNSVTLNRLHQIVQVAMGWEDSHLHRFLLGKRERGPGYRPEVLDEALTLLEAASSQQPKPIRYEYDFGDDWVHDVQVERAFAPESAVRYPRCVGGARQCPPEDCGGPGGYEELLATLQDKRHPAHKERLEWVGRHFDPEVFDLELVNDRLGRLKIRV
jgi:hypothetical protein